MWEHVSLIRPVWGVAIILLLLSEVAEATPAKPEDILNLINAVLRHFQPSCVHVLPPNETGAAARGLAGAAQLLWLLRRLRAPGSAGAGAGAGGVAPERLELACPRGRPLVVVLPAAARALHQLQARPESLSRARWLLLLASPADAGWDAVAALAPPVDCEFLVAAPWPAAAPPAAVACRAEPPPRTLLSAGAHRGWWLWEVWAVPGAEPRRFCRRWGWWAEDGLRPPSASLWARRQDLNGARLRAVVKEYSPLLLLHERPDSPEIRVRGGYFGHTWLMLEKALNFTTHYFSPADDLWGEEGAGGRWNGVVGAVQRAEADAALSGYDALPERAAAVDFSQPLVISNTYVLVRPAAAVGGRGAGAGPAPRPRWLLPFARRLWLAQLAALPLAAAALLALQKMAPAPAAHGAPAAASAAYVDALLVVVGASCMQGRGGREQPAAARLLCWALHLCAVVVAGAYSSALVASLSVRRVALPFLSFAELANGSYSLSVLAHSTQLTFFKSARDPVLQSIYTRLLAAAEQAGRLPREHRDGLRRVCDEAHAHFATLSVVREAVARLPCVARPVPATAVPARIALLLPRRAPLAPLLAHALERLRGGGVLAAMRGRVWPPLHTKEAVRGRVFVSLEQVSSFFAVASAGAGAAVVLLALELLVARCWRRWRPWRMWRSGRALSNGVRPAWMGASDGVWSKRLKIIQHYYGRNSQSSPDVAAETRKHKKSLLPNQHHVMKSYKSKAAPSLSFKIKMRPYALARCPDCLSERDDVGQRVKPVGTTCFATRLPPSHPCRSRRIQRGQAVDVDANTGKKMLRR